MLWIIEHLGGGAALDHLSAVQHDRLVGELAHDRQVVADQDVGDVSLVGYDGEQNGMVYKITIGRPDIPLKEMGVSISEIGVCCLSQIIPRKTGSRNIEPGMSWVAIAASENVRDPRKRMRASA